MFHPSAAGGLDAQRGASAVAVGPLSNPRRSHTRKGLVRNSTAPAFMASTVSGSSATMKTPGSASSMKRPHRRWAWNRVRLLPAQLCRKPDVRLLYSKWLAISSSLVCSHEGKRYRLHRLLSRVSGLMPGTIAVGTLKGAPAAGTKGDTLA
jgi:hypothetical protein